MDRQSYGGYSNGGDASAGGGLQEPRWACPFYKSNPIRHEACVAYRLGRVADIRQHVKRIHAEEVKERINELESRDVLSKTNRDRWYAIWSILFPGQSPPESPYHTETEYADLLAILARRFMEQRKGEGLSAEGERVLMGFVAFTKTTTLDMKSGHTSALVSVSHR